MPWLISLVFVMHLVALFYHSNDVFIGAHIETIEKFKKYIFQIMNMSLTLILRWKLCYLGLASISTMRCGIYEDAMKEYGLGPNNEILHQVLLYRTVSWMSILAPNVSVITTGTRLTIDMFRNKHFFFSMVLEKVSLKQSREHWLRIPYGVEWRFCLELKCQNN